MKFITKKKQITMSISPQIARIEPLIVHTDGTLHEAEPPEDLLFYQGWQPTSVADGKDVEESQHVGQAVQAIAKQCWFNSRRAVFQLPQMATASYVEGWVMLAKGFAIEHGWIVYDGKIIDPTLPDGIIKYFPGLEFRCRLGIQEFLATPKGRECKRSPFFFAFGWGGMRSPTFRKCAEAAIAFISNSTAGAGE